MALKSTGGAFAAFQHSLTVLSRKFGKSGEGIGYADYPVLEIPWNVQNCIFRYYAVCCAVPERLDSEKVSVKMLPYEGEQPCASPDAPAVRGKTAATGFEQFIQFTHNHFVPVLPNPPSPLSDAESSSVGSHSMRSWRARTIWAMRSPLFTSNGSEERLTRITLSSPL